MASAKLFLGILAYLCFVSILVGYAAAANGYVSGVPNVYSLETPTSASPIDTASSLYSIFQMVTLVLVWNVPEAIFPLWANILFIKVPLATLILIVIDVVLP